MHPFMTSAMPANGLVLAGVGISTGRTPCSCIFTGFVFDGLTLAVLILVAINYVWIFYHIAKLKQCEFVISFVMEDNDPFVIQCQYRSNYVVDLVVPEYSGFSTNHVLTQQIGKIPLYTVNIPWCEHANWFAMKMSLLLAGKHVITINWADFYVLNRINAMSHEHHGVSN